MAWWETYIEYLQAVREKTDQIAVSAASGHWDEVLAKLSERQRLMSEIDNLPRMEAGPFGDQRASAIQLVQGVMQEDRGIVAGVEAAMAATREEAAHNQVAQATMGAYRKTSKVERLASMARFMDKQS